jgi:hypothetical protein
MSREQLQKGDHVEVRSAAEILATLDERGTLGSLPFMPEMVRFCGERFTVSSRAERVCDRVGWTRSLNIADTVVLEEQRCDGSGHDGCEAECRLFWKEAWLRRVSASNPSSTSDKDAPSTAALLDLVSANTTDHDQDGSARRYRCQATQSLEAATPLSAKDPRPYIREYTTGNVSLVHFTRVMARAAVMESASKLHVLSEPHVRGPSPTSPRLATIGLQPGDWVRVKSRRQIEATLNDKGKNRGLWFDREMLAYCGQVLRVRRRINRFIDERTGEMVELHSDCVTLDDAVCSGENSLGRWFCPRAIFAYWREGWLERVDSPATG